MLRLGAQVDDRAEGVVRVQAGAVGGGGFVRAGGAVEEGFAEEGPAEMGVDSGGYVAEVEEGLKPAVVEGLGVAIG